MDSPTSFHRSTVTTPDATAIELFYEIEVGEQRRAVGVSQERYWFVSRFVEQFADESLVVPPHHEVADLADCSAEDFHAAWTGAVQHTETVPLFCAADPDDIAALEETGWQGWPRINPDKPMFCPVPVEDHASRITRESQTAKFGVGYVLRFEIMRAYLDRYPRHRMTKRSHEEYWIPWTHLRDFNDHIVGGLVTVDEYHKAARRPALEGGRELMALTRPKVRATAGLGDAVGQALGAADGGGRAAPRRPASSNPLADFGL